MSNLTVTSNRIVSMSVEDVEKVGAIQNEVLKLEQVKMATDHILHGGMYARTIMIPAGVILTGALIKVATVLIVSGDALVYREGKAHEIVGYNVIAASKHRKMAFVARSDTYLTMIFPSKADSIAQAEEEFTDEAHILFSRANDALNNITITGE